MKRERIEELSELINKRGKLTLEQLEEYFPKVSQMTLRRDLFQLEEEGKIIRIRGGALSVKDVQKTSGEPYVKKTALHTDEKIAIAQKVPCWWTKALPFSSTAAPRRCILRKNCPI